MSDGWKLVVSLVLVALVLLACEIAAAGTHAKLLNAQLGTQYTTWEALCCYKSLALVYPE